MFKMRPTGINGYVLSVLLGRQSNIDGIRSAFRFDGVIRKAIHELKYRDLRAIAGQLAALLAQHLASVSLPGDILVPVPLHNQRMRERGYNQSVLIPGK